MKTIKKIRQKIEELYNGEAPKHDQQCDFSDGYFTALSRIDELLDTLESEKSIIPNGLDEEVHRFFDECIEVHEVPLYGKVKENVITADCYEITARHFAQWGVERQKEQDEMSKINYEGARAVYDNTVQHLQEKIDEKYELGKKDMKEQMMKEAMEADVNTYRDLAAGKSWAEFVVEMPTNNLGDKVHIIIVKEN